MRRNRNSQWQQRKHSGWCWAESPLWPNRNVVYMRYSSMDFFSRYFDAFNAITYKIMCVSWHCAYVTVCKLHAENGKWNLKYSPHSTQFVQVRSCTRVEQVERLTMGNKSGLHVVVGIHSLCGQAHSARAPSSFCFADISAVATVANEVVWATQSFHVFNATRFSAHNSSNTNPYTV